MSEMAWVEINLTALEQNYEAVRRKIGPDVQLLGVVKADAYGHGLVPVSLFWQELGIDMLGVSTVKEGAQLRQAGVRIPILVFNPFLPEEIADLVEFNLTATLAHQTAVFWLKDWLAEKGGTLEVHLKVETGMGRYGLWPAEVQEVLREIKAIPGLHLSGIYSHLATAMWRNKTFSQRQFALFQKVCADLEEAGYRGLLRHIANSAAVLALPEMYLEMVRVGTLLYGQYPDRKRKRDVELKETWCLKAKVVYIRELPGGYTVGYERTFKTHKVTPVAILAIGFADGVAAEPCLRPRGWLGLLKGMGKLFLRYCGWPKMGNEVYFPGGVGRLIGRVGMQFLAVDVSGIAHLEVGTTASLMMRRTGLDSSISKVYRTEEEAEGGKMKDGG